MPSERSFSSRNAGQPLRVQQRLRLLVEERLVGRAAALGQHQELVLRRRARARCTARSGPAGWCRCCARPRTRSAPSASSAGSARRRRRRCPGRWPPRRRRRCSTVSVRLPTTIAVPVSWHIGSTPPAATQALRSRSVATNRSLGEASGSSTMDRSWARCAGRSRCWMSCTASCTSAVMVVGSISRKVRPSGLDGARRGQVEAAVVGVVRAERQHVGVVELGHRPNLTGRQAGQHVETGRRPVRPPGVRRTALPAREPPSRIPPVAAASIGSSSPAAERRRVAAMPGSILGTSVRRVEDLELITGASTYVGNLALHGVAAPGLRPLAAGARPDHRDRHRRRGRRGPGVLAVLHRRRPRPARAPRADGDQPGAAAPAAGHRPGPVRRRGGRGRRRPRPRPPRSTRSSWSRSTTTRCPRSSTRRPRSPRAPRRSSTGRANLAAGVRAGRRRPAGRRRGRGAGPDGQPAAGRACRWRATRSPCSPRPRRSADARHDLTIWVSTQMPHGFRAQARRALRAGRRSGSG